MKYTSLLLFILIMACKGTEYDTIPATPTELELKINAQLGEGAFWNHEDQTFWWVDIEGKQLHIYNPESTTNHSFDMPSRIGTVVPQTDSTAVVALEDGVYILNLNTEELNQISDAEGDNPKNRFNDGKADPNGNLWVGSMRMDESIADASLYRITPSGETTEMLRDITISNGIVWTKDTRTMYYIDTPTKTIRAFDFNPETNSISNERVAVEVSESLGFPDGMAIDEEDKLWVGLWNGNAVARFDPETGEVIQKIDVPAHNVTACAFGGPNLDILYITTASVDMTDEEKKKFPLAGSVFRANPGVRGVKSCLFGTE